MPDDLCKVLEWDSEFFGRRIARYCIDELTEATAAAALDWCGEHEVDCLYVPLRNDPESIALAGRLGFVHADTRITLSRVLSHAEGPPPEVRTALASDVPALRAIARCGHHDSRFYHDPHFPREICDAFYETWIERSCQGWADRVLVTPRSGPPSGYISCHVSPEGYGSIGLIAVGVGHRRNGYGGRLIAGALEYFRDRGVETVRVVTQERNRDGRRLYERHGFTVESSAVYYHAWPATREKAG
jgi:dTDP-4-amino-4,6-dideoxy-D-galactose acyltransferase